MALKTFGSRSFGALAFGALTLAGLSSSPAPTTATSSSGGGSSARTITFNTQKTHVEVDTKARIIAMQHTDDDMLLELIIGAVTQEFLT